MTKTISTEQLAKLRAEAEAVSAAYVPFNPANLIGKTIVSITNLTKKEIKACGWEPDHDPITVLVLNDGTAVIPMSDVEGNDGGALMHTGNGNYIFAPERRKAAATGK